MQALGGRLLRNIQRVDGTDWQCEVHVSPVVCFVVFLLFCRVLRWFEHIHKQTDYVKFYVE